MVQIELAVQDPAGVAVAIEAGCDRIELCSALSLGGLTPSVGLIEHAVARGVEAHVLVRPRAGGFAYDDAERALIVADARAAVAAGAAGVVVGGVHAGGVDEGLIAAVVEAVPDAEVTFHRAFDELEDRELALERLVAAGVTRVLTSGGASAAADALDVLRLLVRVASGRIQIMAGGGVTPGNVEPVMATGVDAVHASAKQTLLERSRIRLGSDSPGGEVGRETTDPRVARALVDIVRRHGAPR